MEKLVREARLTSEYGERSEYGSEMKKRICDF
jgi:hypothetical protein